MAIGGNINLRYPLLTSMALASGQSSPTTVAGGPRFPGVSPGLLPYYGPGDERPIDEDGILFRPRSEMELERPLLAPSARGAPGTPSQFGIGPRLRHGGLALMDLPPLLRTLLELIMSGRGQVAGPSGLYGHGLTGGGGTPFFEVPDLPGFGGGGRVDIPNLMAEALAGDPRALETIRRQSESAQRFARIDQLLRELATGVGATGQTGVAPQAPAAPPPGGYGFTE